MDAALKNLESDLDNIAISDILTHEELVYFKSKLLQKKREVLEQSRSAIVSKKIVLDANEMKDELDIAAVTIEQELTFRLLDRSRKLLKEIDHALLKMETGDYGYCEGTGELIPKKRLELAPWVRHSVEHKQNLEFRKKILKQSRSQEGASFFN